MSGSGHETVPHAPIGASAEARVLRVVAAWTGARTIGRRRASYELHDGALDIAEFGRQA